MADGCTTAEDSGPDEGSDHPKLISESDDTPQVEILVSDRPIGLPTLNVLSLIAMGFFWVSGGMYGNEELLTVAAPGYALPALLIVPVLYSAPISLINSELASALPLEGGSVAWVGEALGNNIGGHNAYWTWFAYVMDSSLYPRFAAAYLSQQMGGGYTLECIMAMVIVVLVTIVKLMGMQSVAQLSMVLSAISVLPSFVLVGLGLHRIKWERFVATSGPATNWSELVTWALWLYSGALSLGSVAKDVKNAGRTYLISASVLYVLDVLVVNFIPLLISLSIDPDREDYTAGHFVHIGNELGGGKWLGVLLTVGSQISLIGLYQSGSVASDQYLSRLLHSHIFPTLFPQQTHLSGVSSQIQKRSGRRFRMQEWLLGDQQEAGVPRVMALINMSIALLLCWLSISDTLTVSILLSSLSIFLMVTSFVVLKFKRPKMPRGYAVPGGKIGAILVSLPVMILSLVNLGLGMADTSITLWGVPVRSVAFAIVVVVGAAAHLAGKLLEDSRNRRSAKRDSTLAHLIAQSNVYGAT